MGRYSYSLLRNVDDEQRWGSLARNSEQSMDQLFNTTIVESITKYLINLGADIFAKDASGQTVAGLRNLSSRRLQNRNFKKSKICFRAF